MLTKPKKLAFFTLMAGVVFLAAEVLAGFAIDRVKLRLRFPEPTLYLTDAEDAAHLALRFDADLGWRTPYNQTPFGERPRARDYARPLIATFGDSFTHGDEVGDTETWQEALAEKLGGDVYNFGVGAYGLDQALLRYEKIGLRQPTPVVILAFISGDLERCFRRFRKFHHPESNFAYTKPRLLLSHDELTLLPNPVRTIEALEAGVQDVSFISRIAREDESFNPFDLPPLRRPYTLMLLRPALWRAVLASRNPPSRWESEGGVRLAEKILLRFANAVRERGGLPIVLQLPLDWELKLFVTTGDLPSVVASTQAICARNNLHCLFPLSSAEQGGTERDVWPLFARGQKGGHYSAEGNRWIARFVADKLLEIAPKIIQGTHTVAEPTFKATRSQQGQVDSLAVHASYPDL